ncbi:MAG: RimJ/RimL family protein N-acetyltransferase [Rhodothermales bacterium]
MAAIGVMQSPKENGLVGPRIRFDRLRLENIYTHFKWNNDPELNRLDSEIPYVEETFGAFKKRFERIMTQPDPECKDFEIHTEDGTLIGVAFVAGISGHHLHCSIGVTIGERDFWGQGYGREAMSSLLSYCFESLGMHRVTADCFAYNEAWRSLVEGMGFTAEGTDREYLLWDDKYYDRIRYGMLSGEFVKSVKRVRRKSVGIRRPARSGGTLSGVSLPDSKQGPSASEAAA